MKINWNEFKFDAEEISKREILFSEFFHSTITSHNSFCAAISALLSISFGQGGSIPSTVWKAIFDQTFSGHNKIIGCASARSSFKLFHFTFEF